MVYPERAAPVALVQLSWPSRITRARSSSGGRLGLAAGAAGSGAGGGLVTGDVAGAGGLSVAAAVLADDVVWGGGREATPRTSHPNKRTRHDWTANCAAYFITNSLDQDMPPAGQLSKKYSTAQGAARRVLELRLERRPHNRARLLDHPAQMGLALEAFGVDFVNVLRARRAGREPAALRRHFQATDGGAVARRLG